LGDCLNMSYYCERCEKTISFYELYSFEDMTVCANCGHILQEEKDQRLDEEIMMDITQDWNQR